MSLNYVSILSTHAQDVLTNRSGKVLSVQKGGPIFFLEKSLRLLNVPYKSTFGKEVIVNILITQDGEYGTINIPPKIIKAEKQKLSDWIIISTLLDEWDITNLIKNNGIKLFIDIQGYVRDGKNLGKKHPWEQLASFHQNIYCIKGTEEEISCISKEILEEQKKKMLIITRGSEGLDLFYKN